MGRFHANITGFYIGLTKKSKENLGKSGLQAHGYAFDVLNNSDDFDMERPFVGLFETLFLEQSGSIKRYISNNGKIIAQRYPYEYERNGQPTKEALHVKDIQRGALQFAEDYTKSYLNDYIGKNSNLMFSNLYQVGIDPTLYETKLFGDFNFFNNGSKVYLAKPKSIAKYVRTFKQFKLDLYDSQWKIGFLKRLLRIKLPYLKVFYYLKKVSDKQ